MSRYSTPTLSARVKALIALWWVVVAAASLFFFGNPTVPVLFGVLLLASYAGWRFLVAAEAAADALQRIAAAREREN